jgi:hypothetical protein
MALPRLRAEHGLSSSDVEMVARLLAFPLPIDLHVSMFVTTIRGQGTDAQIAHWLPQAERFSILGTYAQTEVCAAAPLPLRRLAMADLMTALGWGGVGVGRWAMARTCAAWRRSPCTTQPRNSLSFTALPTRPSSGGQGATAQPVLEPQSAREGKQPPLSLGGPPDVGAHAHGRRAVRLLRLVAYAWRGVGGRGLGKTATHCVLMARLFLHGKDYGPHPFILQLRCLQTHRPLPGVELGDIGPKARTAHAHAPRGGGGDAAHTRTAPQFGYNTIDNGYLRLSADPAMDGRGRGTARMLTSPWCTGAQHTTVRRGMRC